MTVKEFYEWAVANGYDDFRMVKIWNDGGCYVGDMSIKVIEKEKVILFSDIVEE